MADRRFKEQYDLLATNETFRKRVVMGFFTAARQIAGESVETPGHALRASFARGVVVSTDVSQAGYVAAIATDPDVIALAVAGYNPQNPDSAQAAVDDDAILAAILEAWNTLAGA